MVFHVRGTAGIAAFLPGWGSTGGAPGEPVQPGAEVLSGRRLSYGQGQFQESPEYSDLVVRGRLGPATSRV